MANIIEQRLKKIADIFKNKKYLDETKKTTMSIRVNEDIKRFYEVAANQTENSVQGAMVLALKEYKDIILAHDIKNEIEDHYRLLFNNIFQLFKRSKIPYTKWHSLISGISTKQINPDDLLNLNRLVSICDEDFLNRICEIFDVDYEWLIGENKSETPIASNKYYVEIRHHYIGAIKKIVKSYQDHQVQNVALFLVDHNNLYDQYFNNKNKDDSLFQNTDRAKASLWARVEYNINNVEFETLHYLNIRGIVLDYKPCYNDLEKFMALFYKLLNDHDLIKISKKFDKTINCYSFKDDLTGAYNISPYIFALGQNIVNIDFEPCVMHDINESNNLIINDNEYLALKNQLQSMPNIF